MYFDFNYWYLIRSTAKYIHNINVLQQHYRYFASDWTSLWSSLFYSLRDQTNFSYCRAGLWQLQCIIHVNYSPLCLYVHRIFTLRYCNSLPEGSKWCVIKEKKKDRAFPSNTTCGKFKQGLTPDQVSPQSFKSCKPHLCFCITNL